MIDTSLSQTIDATWGGTGLKPVKILEENDFGYLFIQDVDGRIWRLCPEDAYCEVVANARHIPRHAVCLLDRLRQREAAPHMPHAKK
ncbi:MAG: hypothetical protein AAFW75_01245 [Cyanobacteria bacterium J06636_16]